MSNPFNHKFAVDTRKKTIRRFLKNEVDIEVIELLENIFKDCKCKYILEFNLEVDNTHIYFVEKKEDVGFSISYTEEYGVKFYVGILKTYFEQFTSTDNPSHNPLGHFSCRFYQCLTPWFRAI